MKNLPALEDHIEDPSCRFPFPTYEMGVRNEGRIPRVLTPVTHFIRPFIGVTTPFITGMGPSCSPGEVFWVGLTRKKRVSRQW